MISKEDLDALLKAGKLQLGRGFVAGLAKKVGLSRSTVSTCLNGGHTSIRTTQLVYGAGLNMIKQSITKIEAQRIENSIILTQILNKCRPTSAAHLPTPNISGPDVRLHAQQP